MIRSRRKAPARPKGPKSVPSAMGRSAAPRIVLGALSPRQSNALRREVETFCAIPDVTDIEDAQRALPAQWKVLGHD